jgi:Mce-associated membrane protein
MSTTETTEATDATGLADSAEKKLSLPSMRSVSAGVRLTSTRSLIVFAVLVVAVACGGFMLSRSNGSTADEHDAAADALAAATQAVPSLLTYDASTVAGLAKDESGVLTDSFAAEYTKLVNEELAPAAKQRQLVTQTEVASGGVVTEGKDRVTVLLFLNQVSLAKGMKTPAETGSRVRVVLQRVGGEWRIDKLTPL